MGKKNQLNIVCDYSFTEETYRAYLKARSRRSMRYYGILILLFALVFLATGIVGNLGQAAGGMVALLAVGLWFIISPPLRVSEKRMHDFFERHGADMWIRPWSFNNLVMVDDSSISVTFKDNSGLAQLVPEAPDKKSKSSKQAKRKKSGVAGADGTAAENLVMLNKIWEQWSHVVETPGIRVRHRQARQRLEPASRCKR